MSAGTNNCKQSKIGWVQAKMAELSITKVILILTLWFKIKRGAFQPWQNLDGLENQTKVQKILLKNFKKDMFLKEKKDMKIVWEVLTEEVQIYSKVHKKKVHRQDFWTWENIFNFILLRRLSSSGKITSKSV